MDIKAAQPTGEVAVDGDSVIVVMGEHLSAGNHIEMVLKTCHNVNVADCIAYTELPQYIRSHAPVDGKMVIGLIILVLGQEHLIEEGELRDGCEIHCKVPEALVTLPNGILMIRHPVEGVSNTQ